MVCLMPFGFILWDVINQNLSANPIEDLSHRTGAWTLRFLLIVLSVTPLRHVLNWPGIVRYRRMLGLFAFFYASLHFLIYFVLDLSLALSFVIEDITERPYLTVGFTAFVLLIPLAITSTNKMMRRMGKHWKRLHQSVYLIAILGVLHYIWLVKADLRDPIIYAVLLGVLLLFRVWMVQKKRKARASRGDPSESAVKR